MAQETLICYQPNLSDVNTLDLKRSRTHEVRWTRFGSTLNLMLPISKDRQTPHSADHRLSSDSLKSSTTVSALWNSCPVVRWVYCDRVAVFSDSAVDRRMREHVSATHWWQLVMSDVLLCDQWTASSPTHATAVPLQRLENYDHSQRSNSCWKTIGCSNNRSDILSRSSLHPRK